jgi:hypothetical protein
MYNACISMMKYFQPFEKTSSNCKMGSLWWREQKKTCHYVPKKYKHTPNLWNF